MFSNKTRKFIFLFDFFSINVHSRNEDQEILKKILSPSPELELFSSNDFQMEYYTISRRKSKCKTCKQSIQNKSIAIYMVKQKAWYDLECFQDLQSQCDSSFKIER
jgi:hypothetical protein